MLPVKGCVEDMCPCFWRPLQNAIAKVVENKRDIQRIISDGWLKYSSLKNYRVKYVSISNLM